MIDTLKYLFYSFGYFLVIISLIPLIRNDNWMFRIFEYPRAQKLIINLVLLLSFLIGFKIEGFAEGLYASLLSLNFCYLMYQVWPYTVLSRHQLKGVKTFDASSRITIFIANVFQENRDIDACCREIGRYQPDVILLVETDEWWKKELDKRLNADYPHYLGKPQNNTYGIVMYSKLELVDAQVKQLVEADIPSIHTKIKLRNNDLIQLYGLHPTPPVPQENPRSTERDGEILMVAKEAKSQKLPVIVAGDMNDVAWSYTTELFLKVSKLLDPRRGRGFYNTFNSHYWFSRWPLDHVFCSTHFELLNLKRVASIGSDHFPMFIDLHMVSAPVPENEEEMLDAEPEEERFASQKIRKAKKV